MENFYIGQTFKDEYPPELASWCNQNAATIKLNENGLFEIYKAPIILHQIEEITFGDLEQSINDLGQIVSNNSSDKESIYDAIEELGALVSALYAKDESK